MMRWNARVWYRPPTQEDAFLPEGPRLLQWQGQPWVIWVNIQLHAQATQGRIHLLQVDPKTWAPSRCESLICPGRPGFVLPTDQEGVVLVGMDHALYLLDWVQQQWSAPLVELPQRHPRTTINDGEVTPDGQVIVFGTKDVLFREPLGHLYLYDLPRRRLHVLAEGQTCSNGKVLRQEAEGLILYDIDTPTRQVRKYRLEVDSGRAELLGVALDLHGWEGFPDGICAADENSVIIALYHPGERESGRAVRFDLLSQQAVEEWDVPFSPRVTCPLLLPPDRSSGGGAQLLLTTADEGMPPEIRQRNPNVGCLFLAPTGVSAAPPPAMVRIRATGVSFVPGGEKG